MLDKDDFFESFCRGVLERDHFIRFAGISNHLGHLVATAYRKDPDGSGEGVADRASA